REGLDAQGARVAGVVERGEDVAPGQVVGAGGAAVVRAHLDVGDAGAGPADRGGHVPLLDVEVVDVEEDADVGHRGERLQCLVDRVDQRGLVPVEGLDGDPHPGLHAVLGHGGQVLGELGVAAAPLVVVHPPRAPHGGVGGPGDDRGADGVGGVDDAPQVVLGAAHGRVVGGDELAAL